MTLRRIAVLATLAAACCAVQAQPTPAEYYPFAEIMSMKMIDKNKDGMVSKKEYMAMAEMAWDMNAKKMGMKGAGMTPDQFNQFLQYLKAGG